MKVIIHYVLAILEGGLAGGLFYYAGQEKTQKRKVLMYVASALAFLLSLMDSLEAGREWKELRAAKAYDEDEEDYEDYEGEYDDE